MERDFETMTAYEKQTAFTAICYWVGTNLTHSVYVLDCFTPKEAEQKSYDYFFDKRGIICEQIKRIEILPQGKGRWDNCKPVFVRNYVKEA